MIVSKPRRNTVLALALFLLLVLVSFFFLLDSLLRSPDYFVIKLILTPALLVIAVLVFSKMSRSFKTVKIGKEKIEVESPFGGKKTTFSLNDILGWKEEVVKMRNGDFKEVSILYGGKKVLKRSNKENTEYDRIVKYLLQKAKRKQVG